MLSLSLHAESTELDTGVLGDELLPHSRGVANRYTAFKRG